MHSGEVSRGRSVAVGINDRWNVTCDLPHVTHVTHDFLLQKVQKSDRRIIKSIKIIIKKKSFQK